MSGFLEQLARIKEGVRVHLAESRGAEDTHARLDGILLALLDAEEKFVKERGAGSLSLPSAMSSVTGFPSLPSFLQDIKHISEKDETVRGIFESREISARCPHCFCNVKPGDSVRFVPIVTFEEVKIREEGTWLALSLVHRSECNDENYLRFHNDPELAGGLEKVIVSRRWRWSWNDGELQVE